MADFRFSSKNVTPVAHIPTALLVIGYAVFWLELFFLNPAGCTTTPFAWILSAIAGGSILFIHRQDVRRAWSKSVSFFCSLSIPWKCFFVFSAVLIVFLNGVIVRALLLPVHLPQEFDALNYHITLPRQHLLLQSFRHLPWSSADLFLMPVQYALAPYWLTSQMPLKLVQYVFVLGLLGVSLRLMRNLGGRSGWAAALLIFSYFGLHGLRIQMSALMLDIIFCYLAIAFADSFMEKRFITAGIELAFLFWGKSFFPGLFSCLFIGIAAIQFAGKKAGFLIKWGLDPDELKGQISRSGSKNFLIIFFLASIFIGGPFLFKSLFVAGTPLYPFFVGKLPVAVLSPQKIHALKDTAGILLKAKDSYGLGRSFLDGVKHFWLIAVPTKGVNNPYDYPLGLPYLLFLVPFVVFSLREIHSKRLPVLSFFVFMYWLLWWFGSQQSRFLYIPVMLMIIVTIPKVQKRAAIPLMMLSLAIMLNCFSSYRANAKDFKKPLQQVLREKDRRLMQQNEALQGQKGGEVSLPYYDAAFACFPIRPDYRACDWLLKPSSGK